MVIYFTRYNYRPHTFVYVFLHCEHKTYVEHLKFSSLCETQVLTMYYVYIIIVKLLILLLLESNNSLIKDIYTEWTSWYRQYYIYVWFFFFFTMKSYRCLLSQVCLISEFTFGVLEYVEFLFDKTKLKFINHEKSIFESFGYFNFLLYQPNSFKYDVKTQ